ncbi:hypothetical protein AB6A23_14625 [Paenibacillus tarimensis]
MVKHWLPIAAVGVLAISLVITVLAMDYEKANGIYSQKDLESEVRVEQAGEASTDTLAGTNNMELDEEPLPLMEKVNQELTKLAKPAGNMVEWTRSVVSGYDDTDGPIDVFETDLDQDGVTHEWVTVLAEAVRDQQTGELLQRNAYGAVISYAEGKFSIQSFAFPASSFGRAKVETIADLTGDGKPEVVWVSLDIGAHTTHSTYTVSSWSAGKLETIEGTAEIDNVSNAEIMDGNLVLTGGLIGSAGAGPWQREFTDYYSVVNHTIQRTERVFESSPTPYHRLIDGLWAEAHGRTERALEDYTRAIAMESPSYKDYYFVFEGDWVQGEVETEKEKQFERIVKQSSRLRKELLTETLQGASPKNACAAAKEKSGYEEGWLPYLNAPAGYANPAWGNDNICSGIDELNR